MQYLARPRRVLAEKALVQVVPGFEGVDGGRVGGMAADQGGHGTARHQLSQEKNDHRQHEQKGDEQRHSPQGVRPERVAAATSDLRRSYRAGLVAHAEGAAVGASALEVLSPVRGRREGLQARQGPALLESNHAVDP